MNTGVSKKRYGIILVGIAVIILLIVFFYKIIILGQHNNNSSNTSVTSQDTTNSITNISETGIIAKIEANKEKVLSYRNSSATEFVYELKDSYNSREEILQEKADLGSCYKAFIETKDDKIKTEARITVERLMEDLTEKLKKYPPSDEEILQDKMDYIKQEIGYYATEFKIAEQSSKNSPDNEAYKKKYQECKAAYEKALNIQEKYSKGEITIDEALEQLGINYTGRP